MSSLLSRMVIRRVTNFAEKKWVKQSSCFSSSNYFHSSSYLLGKNQLDRQESNKEKSVKDDMGKSVVVVESITKAKSIQGFLGDMYKVVPSGGHVRDLANWADSVLPDEDFAMVWLIPPSASSHLDAIKLALTTSGVKNLILALDPDREGEAIAWHIIDILEQQGSLGKNIVVSRVVFHEITESSIKKALLTPRPVDLNLVHSYLASRALEYLTGFKLFPLFRSKLPGCHFPGRVQSAGLAIICEREIEIDRFEVQKQNQQEKHWTIDVKLNMGSVDNAVSFPAKLTCYDSNTLNQLSDRDANRIQNQLSSENFKVLRSKTNKLQENPPTLYMTSTLLEDALNKLHFSLTYTMELAQKLYDGIQLSDGRVAGLITYMRTNGCHISDETVKHIHLFATERYGQKFASASPRECFKKVKNAQEAHEAIRPTNISRLPSMLKGILDEDSLKLYTLIWSCTVASQMEPATINQIQVDIGNDSESIVFSSTCSMVEFLGHQVVFQDVEAKAIRHQEYEENGRNEVFGILDSLKIGDPLYICEMELKQHHPQPPPRYSVETLVKKMVDLGIGRASTYASTLKILQERDFVTMKDHVLYPKFRGRMVSAFLNQYFSGVIDYSSTADMETELDNVSIGLTEWKALLRDYWIRFSSHYKTTSIVETNQVEKMLEEKFEDFLFSSHPDKSRTCPICLEGTLVVKVNQSSGSCVFGCDQQPKCRYIAKTLEVDEEAKKEESERISLARKKPKLLGVHPDSNEKIILKHSRYGPFIQLGEDNRILKYVHFNHIKDLESVTLKDALELLQYPVTLGTHPDDGRPVVLIVGKSGFTVRHRFSYASVPKKVNPKDVDLAKALVYLSGDHVRHRGRVFN